MEVIPGQRYRHIKTGGVYEVLALARIEATLRDVVVYRHVNAVTWSPTPGPGNVWVRPADEFCDGRFVAALSPEELT